jgi:hypothetical protein
VNGSGGLGYRLLAMGDGSAARKRDVQPILFIPGHLGRCVM